MRRIGLVGFRVLRFTRSKHCVRAKWRAAAKVLFPAAYVATCHCHKRFVKRETRNVAFLRSERRTRSISNDITFLTLSLASEKLIAAVRSKLIEAAIWRLRCKESRSAPLFVE